jgi:hypothetical protein
MILDGPAFLNFVYSLKYKLHFIFKELLEFTDFSVIGLVNILRNFRVKR